MAHISDPQSMTSGVPVLIAPAETGITTANQLRAAPPEAGHGIAVVVAPAEIDITGAGQFRAVLLAAAAGRGPPWWST